VKRLFDDLNTLDSYLKMPVCCQCWIFLPRTPHNMKLTRETRSLQLPQVNLPSANTPKFAWTESGKPRKSITTPASELMYESINSWILWHTCPKKNCEVSRESRYSVTASQTSMFPCKLQRRAVFSVRSVPRCYKQNRELSQLVEWSRLVRDCSLVSELVNHWGSVVVSCCC
jgi:hypothetical protein